MSGGYHFSDKLFQEHSFGQWKNPNLFKNKSIFALYRKDTISTNLSHSSKCAFYFGGGSKLSTSTLIILGILRNAEILNCMRILGLSGTNFEIWDSWNFSRFKILIRIGKQSVLRRKILDFGWEFMGFRNPVGIV